ncbi:hypothetical protein JAK41_16710 [Stenotrophomonas maltophilia]|uniref:hypothetical protein n=1 Tax=Stenotrophomonas maltophilia TaxID=40324 RepID=UPI0021CA8B2B|nr:hypothetical protein [Stenotrophomonas maltophilia]MCU1159799.1 hypothetical protein [Stenotrophomonas maltophilia]
MARPFTRSTSTFVVALLKSYPGEELPFDQLVAELLRYAQQPDAELEGVKYRPNGVRRAGNSPWFREHVDRQLNILSSLGLVIRQGELWRLQTQVRQLPPDTAPVPLAGVPGESGPDLMSLGKGLAQVLAHPSLFCLPEADFHTLVDLAFEELP